MKNVYMTPLKYKNFDGVEKTTKLYFHVTPREFTDWMIDNKDKADELIAAFTDYQEQAEGDLDGEASMEQKLTMLKLVRILAEISYGKPMDDGEVFDKTGIKKFVHSAAYDAFRLFLFENPKELIAFINTLLNEEVISEFSGRVQQINEQQPAVEQKPAEQTNYDGMTRDELVAAMKAKTQQ